jgi:hypothetical protein
MRDEKEILGISHTEIDAALDAILIASGSALKYYTMPSTKEMMRHAMSQIIKKAYMDGYSACHRSIC